MKFVKYNEIENSYNKYFINKILYNGGHQHNWVVTEKVHGANFSFWTDGKIVRCAKRSTFVCSQNGSSNAGFYNYEVVKEKYEQDVLDFYQTLLKHNYIFDDNIVVICGEIFGGKYKGHKSTVKPIQTEVDYCPHLDFYAFDVKILDKNGVGTYLNWAEFKHVMSWGHFPVNSTLNATEMSFEDALQVDPEQPTSLPKIFDLEQISDNIGEGFVLKPVVDMYDNGGSRIILKKKSKKFSEKSTAKVYVPKEFSEEVQNFMKIGTSFVCDNRLSNVLSKEGLTKETVYDKGIGKLIGLLTKDSIEDFIKENPEFLQLEKSGQKDVTKFMTTEAAKLVKQFVMG